VRSILESLRSLCHRNEQSYLFDTVYADDVFLVGYPKSGNTWLRFLVGNYLTNNQYDFINNCEVIPGIQENFDLIESLSPPRFMHTHASVEYFSRSFLNLNKHNPQMVFLVRDGRDVAVSYFFHLKKHYQIDQGMSFDNYLKDFLDGNFHPGQSWGEYVMDWLAMAGQLRRFLLIRYEDLKSNPAQQLSQLLSFSNIFVEMTKVASAVEASSFKEMRRLEKQQQAFHARLKNTDSAIPFVRKGKAGQWEKYFTPELHSIFRERNGQAMIELGYYTDT